MKKLLVIALSAMMLFAFTACQPAGNGPTGTVLTKDNFATAVADGGEYYLEADVAVEAESPFTISKDLTIDLKGNTLSSTVALWVNGANTKLTISNGNLKIDTADNDGSKATISVESNSSVLLDHVTYTSNGCAIFAQKNQQNVKIDILNSMITGATYGIGTNATAPESADVRISVKGSKVTSHTENGDNAGILFNVKGGLTIEDSTITGDRQAVIARGGDHRISNSTLIVTGENNINKEYLDGAWGSGNEVPLSAVVVGNRSASYQYPTTINFTDVKITAPEANTASKNYFEMYVYQNDGTNTVSASGTVESTNEYTVNTESMNDASYTVTLKTAEV